MFNDLLANADAMVLKAFKESEGFTLDGDDIDGIYDGPSERLTMFPEGPGVVSTAPQLTVQTSDIAGISPNGKTVVRKKTGESFIVSGPPKPTGDGWTVLQLREV